MLFDLEFADLMDIPLALHLMWAYVLVANVVLVNLLIAMFSDTYSRIKKNAEIEYHYQRFLHVLSTFTSSTSTPPPFSLPWLVLQLIFRDFVAVLRRSTTDSRECGGRHPTSPRAGQGFGTRTGRLALLE